MIKTIENYVIEYPEYGSERLAFFPKNVKLYTNLYSFCDTLIENDNSRFIVFIHANNDENKRKNRYDKIKDWNDGYELIANISLLICSKGGRVLIFSGGGNWDFNKYEFEDLMDHNHFESEFHYTFCTINKIDASFKSDQLDFYKFESFMVSSLKLSELYLNDALEVDIENCNIDEDSVLSKRLKAGEKILINGNNDFASALKEKINDIFQNEVSENELLFNESIKNITAHALKKLRIRLKNCIILILTPDLLNKPESLIQYYRFLFSNEILDGHGIIGIYPNSAYAEYISKNDIFGTNNPKFKINIIAGLNAISTPFKLSDLIKSIFSFYPGRILHSEGYKTNIKRADLLPHFQIKLIEGEKALINHEFCAANLIYQEVIQEFREMDIDLFFEKGHITSWFYKSLKDRTTLFEKINFLKEFINTYK